ncbi:tripartite tricarboxylate transporter substrate binding protein [Azospirillum agricola]|uniref:tripartite tricarboxylate transporter substrate binding protein n=1 Tax=Azospirillum agricola TaxID=1720247 RepID=UPI000A0EF0F2|nr:tripartite tricarboxylate transporter substrate binding protein [Azospirillum agricola]SMH54395.1 Tripartite-type tricarboxylate transporter, receptor component TctC [Azospirillum lipoferum]
MIAIKLLPFLTVAGVLTASALAPSGARAAYPEKPITMIVAYGAGGSTDVTARMLAPFIEKQLGGGARIVVLNRGGAGGEIGFAAIADAAPDGYTIGFINTPNLITIPIERQARYSLDRLDPLVNVIDDPGVMTVHADSPYKTLEDLVRHAKANPRTATVGSTGVGSDDHLAMLLLERQSGARMIHVPFPGSAENYRAMLGRHTQVCNQNLGEGLRGVAAGDPVRILGVMSAKRWDVAPDIPTFAELGYKIEMVSMRGIGAPKGLPPDIRAKLIDALTKAAQDPEFQAKARETFQPLRILDSAAFTAELTQLDKDFRALWAEMPWLK